MQVTRATFIPLLAAASSDRMDPAAVRDEYSADLTVVYTFGPQFGRRVVTHADLDQMELDPRMLRRSAFEHLEVLSSRAEFHGQPPALMLSFEGLESSLLLASDFWTRLAGAVPGDVVVGVPARDVVIVTGSQSAPGLEKARRCVERVFMAGGENPLTQNLLVRRNGTWEPFDRKARPGGRSAIGPANQLGPAHQLGQGQPPRQYQEHVSWPGERVQAVPQRRQAPAVGGRGTPPPPAGPIAARAASHTSHSLPPVPGPNGPVSGPLSGSLGGAAAAMTNTGTGMTPVPPQVPRQRPAPGRRSVERQQQAPEVAPYSAMPYSSVPYSSVPYSAVPQSPVPTNGAPYAQPGLAQHSGQHASSQHPSPQHPNPQHPNPQHTGPQHAVAKPQPTPAPSKRQSGRSRALGRRTGAIPVVIMPQGDPPAPADMPYSAVPYSATPYSAAPYSAIPYSAAPTAPAQRPRPASHREPEPVADTSRASRLRGSSSPASRYAEEVKPGYRDEPITPERSRDGWARDDRPRDDWARDDRARDDRARDSRGWEDRTRDSRAREDHVRDERPVDGWAREDYARGDYSRGRDDRPADTRYRDDMYSTGTHTMYPPTSATPAATGYARGDGYDAQADVPQPNYPQSWGWAPETSTSRPQQAQRPSSPRDRFAR